MNNDILPATLEELLGAILTTGQKLLELFTTPGWRQ